jgi:transcriptional regulator with XRE-family HTH domain
MLPINTPKEIAEELAKRLRERRLAYVWSREELARRSGVTAASLKRFERNGEISLKSLIKLCFTLHAVDGFDQLLKAEEPKTLADLEKGLKIRMRGRKRG